VDLKDPRVLWVSLDQQGQREVKELRVQLELMGNQDQQVSLVQVVSLVPLVLLVL